MMKHTVLTLALLAAGATSAVIASSACVPGKAAPGAETQSALPGNGPAQHPFLYAAEWDTRKPLDQSIFIVRGGKVVWQYSIPLRSEEHTSELQSLRHLVCRLLLEKKKNRTT